MKAALAVLVLLLCPAAEAQMRMTVEQLIKFIGSSIELKHRDSQVADYLKQVRLTQQLEDSVVEDLQRRGAGPRTVEALRRLREASRGLPPPHAAPPKPAATPIPPPTSADQKEILDHVRDYALNYTRRLPDFICTQVTRRFYDPSGMEVWHPMDTVTARLSYFEQKENYQVVLVNSRPTDVSYEQLGGAISSGEFGTMLKEVFEPESLTRFEWDRWATLRGKLAHVFTYRVAQPQSKWRISYQRTMDVVPAYRGLVYVDAGTRMVLRITLEAINLPAAFPIQQAGTVLDYDYVEIAGAPYLLPLRYVMRMREGRLLVKNEVEFRLYRKFEAEAVITFDTPDPLPEEQIGEKPPAPKN